jgi:Cu-Zn family superoxide dismutase
MNRMMMLLSAGLMMGAVTAGGCAATGSDNHQASNHPTAKAAAQAEHRHMAPESMTQQQSAANEQAVAVIHPTAGNKVHGIVRFIPAGQGKVRVLADLQGLTPNSKHGFHIHEYGDCSASDASSAGGHFNPEHHPHAGPNTEMRHAGDFGNIQADAEGHAHLDMTVDNITINGAKDAILGRAVIVHGKADDLKSQPSGDAGPRIGCGVIGVANLKSGT